MTTTDDLFGGPNINNSNRTREEEKNGKRNDGETYPCNSLLFENVLEKKVPGTATLTGDTDGG